MATAILGISCFTQSGVLLFVLGTVNYFQALALWLPALPPPMNSLRFRFKLTTHPDDPTRRHSQLSQVIFHLWDTHRKMVGAVC